MSKYFEHQVASGNLDLRGKRVIEVGAGCGLLALVLHRLGAHVIVTEIEVILDHMVENIRRDLEKRGCLSSLILPQKDRVDEQEAPPLPSNHEGSGPGLLWVEELDWFKTDLAIFSDWEPLHLIITSDVTVFPQDLPHIDRLFTQLYLRNNSASEAEESGCPILVGACTRREPHEAFLELMEARFGRVNVMGEEVMHPSFSTSRSVIIELSTLLRDDVES